VLNGTHRLKGRLAMNFTEIASKMNKLGTKPSKILVNPTWYEQQLQSTFILHKLNENVIETFTQVKTEFDDSIKTFEFIYE
jgi:hypothetical protein